VWADKCSSAKPVQDESGVNGQKDQANGIFQPITTKRLNTAHTVENVMNALLTPSKPGGELV
jgi:hypothetical protein